MSGNSTAERNVDGLSRRESRLGPFSLEGAFGSMRFVMRFAGGFSGGLAHERTVEAAVSMKTSMRLHW